MEEFPWGYQQKNYIYTKYLTINIKNRFNLIFASKLLFRETTLCWACDLNIIAVVYKTKFINDFTCSTTIQKILNISLEVLKPNSYNN